MELPYFYYQNVIVKLIEFQVQEKPVKTFKVIGDNIGPDQKKYINRVYEKIEADVMMARSKTPVNNPQEKIRFEKVFDGVKNILSNLMEMFFGWLDGFQAQTNRRKERLRKERMEKQRLEELEDEKTFIATELLIEREVEFREKELIIEKERIKAEERLEKEKIKRIKAEERMEKTKLARLEKEADIQKMKKEFLKLETENKELKTQNKELKTQNKELKTQIAAKEVKLEAAINQQQYDPQQYYGR